MDILRLYPLLTINQSINPQVGIRYLSMIHVCRHPSQCIHCTTKLISEGLAIINQSIYRYKGTYRYMVFMIIEVIHIKYCPKSCLRLSVDDQRLVKEKYSAGFILRSLIKNRRIAEIKTPQKLPTIRYMFLILRCDIVNGTKAGTIIFR